jgi:hypothetical protein
MRERALVGVASGAVAMSLTWLDPEWTDMLLKMRLISCAEVEA